MDSDKRSLLSPTAAVLLALFAIVTLLLVAAASGAGGAVTVSLSHSATLNLGYFAVAAYLACVLLAFGAGDGSTVAVAIIALVVLCGLFGNKLPSFVQTSWAWVLVFALALWTISAFDGLIAALDGLRGKALDSYTKTLGLLRRTSGDAKTAVGATTDLLPGS